MIQPYLFVEQGRLLLTSIWWDWCHHKSCLTLVLSSFSPLVRSPILVPFVFSSQDIQSSPHHILLTEPSLLDVQPSRSSVSTFTSNDTFISPYHSSIFDLPGGDESRAAGSVLDAVKSTGTLEHVSEASLSPFFPPSWCVHYTHTLSRRTSIASW